MTAAAMRGDRERCLAAGMDDYVSKPVDPKQLDRVLTRWVSRSEAHPLADVEEPVEPSDQSVEWERVDMLRQMCASGSGPDRWPELIGLFLEDAAQRVRQLDEAVAAGDAEQVRELAHALKGSSANFGAPVLRDLSSRLESLATDGRMESAAGAVAPLAMEYERTREALASTLAGSSARTVETPQRAATEVRYEGEIA
jgi:HPt (histidine-containing phosphotransfer) domain-containing protein